MQHACAESCQLVDVDLLSWLVPSLKPTSVFVFFNSPRTVSKGGRLELLGGGRRGEWRHPIEHDEGGMEPVVRQGILHCMSLGAPK